MSKLKIKHSEVLLALDLVKGEIDKEAKRIYSAGAEALKSGKIEPAQEAIDYSKELESFAKKVEVLSDEWKRIESTINSAAPEVKKIVNLRKTSRSDTAGFKRCVEHVGPRTNFDVIFPDGEIISEAKAFGSFTKTIEKIGAEKVARLNIPIGKEPLVSKSLSAYKKYPSEVKKIKGGWFVLTHSSTSTKIRLLEYIRQELKLEFVIKKR